MGLGSAYALQAQLSLGILWVGPSNLGLTPFSFVLKSLAPFG